MHFNMKGVLSFVGIVGILLQNSIKVVDTNRGINF